MIACGKRNTPKEPTGNEDPKEQSMLERAQEFATFLTDNYQKGDSVYFTHTIVSTSESFREGFAVTVNEFHELCYGEELETEEDENPEEEMDDSDTCEGYKLVTELTSNATRLSVTIANQLFNEKPVESGWFILNGRWDSPDVQMTETKTVLTLSLNDMYCTLNKNTGIVLFGDKDNKWELIR